MNGQLTNLRGNSITALAPPKPNSNLLSRKLLILATIITTVLWFVPYSDIILYPLRLFVTFVHESGHAVASTITGGTVVSLQVKPNGSGLTQTMQSPLFQWLTLSGGYLGTTIFGAILLHVGRLNRWKNSGRATLTVGSLCMLGITLFWARDIFTLSAGLILTAFLWGLARLLPPAASLFAASFIAVQCSLNALSDIRILLGLTSSGMTENDAGFMSKAYPILPPSAWAGLWAIAALLILVISLRKYWRATSNSPARK